MARDRLSEQLGMLGIVATFVIGGAALVLTSNSSLVKGFGWALIGVGCLVLSVAYLHEGAKRDQGIHVYLREVDSHTRDLLRLSGAPRLVEIQRPVIVGVEFTIRNATEHATTSTWPVMTVLRRTRLRWVEAPIEVKDRGLTSGAGGVVSYGHRGAIAVPPMTEMKLSQTLIFTVSDDLFSHVLAGKLRLRLTLDVVGAGSLALTDKIPPADTRLLTQSAGPPATTAPASPPPSWPGSS